MKRLKLTILIILTFLAGQTQTKNFLDQAIFGSNREC